VKRARRALGSFVAITVAAAGAHAQEPPKDPPKEPANEPAKAKTDGPTDVEVHGVRGGKPAKTTLAGDEIRQVPGAFGDAFRAIETLPGVTPIVSGLPFFFVRGAPPGNNGYYLDGVRLPVLYHVGFGPSVVHPGLIERVDFYPGGYPARYGRFAGGILAGETRRPADALHGEGNIRLFDAGALVEGPIADGRGTVLAAGRYSYTAALISIAAPKAKLDYWDYQARATYDLGRDDTIGAFAFGGYDFLGNVEGGKTKTIFATQFHRADLRWDHRLPNRGTMRLATTLGIDSTATEDLAGVRDRMTSTRLYVEQPAGKDVLVRGGLDATLDHYDLVTDGGNADQESLYPPRDDLAFGAHLDAVIRATPRWEVTPGIRADLFGSARRFDAARPAERRVPTNGARVGVDPRLLSRLKLSTPLTIVSTFGVTHQPPAFFIPIPGLQIGRLAQGLQTGVQTSQGLEITLPLAITATPTVFYNHTLGLTDFSTSCGEVNNGDDGNDCIDQRVRGRTIGVELLVRRSLTEKLTGWVSYTLSRTTRATTVSISGARGSYAEIPGDFDRTHVLNVIAAYDLGRSWRAGGRFFFYTGRPYSDRILDVPVPPYNDNRMPSFHRFDARLEKRWPLGKSGHIAFVAEWLNVTLEKEVTSVTCQPTAAGTGTDLRQVQRGNTVPRDAYDRCSFEEIGPITIPSVGVEGAL
jgi:hypothetical protein